MAYVLDDGELREVDWTEQAIRRFKKQTTTELDPWPFDDLTPRQRRRRARKNSGPGRRRARRVERRRWPIARQMDLPIETFKAWPFHDGFGGRVLLYLLDGLRPTEEHCRMLDAVIRRANRGRGSKA